MTACSSPTSASRLPEPTPELAAQPQAGSHPPVILRVVERQEARNGFLVYYQDLYFTDSDGDADYISLEETSSSLSYPLDISGGGIDVPAQEQ